MRWAPPAAGSFLDNKGSSRPRRRKALFLCPGVFQTLCSCCVVFHRSVLSLGDSAETPIPCHCGVGVGGRATQRGCSGGRVSGSRELHLSRYSRSSSVPSALQRCGAGDTVGSLQHRARTRPPRRGSLGSLSRPEGQRPLSAVPQDGRRPPSPATAGGGRPVCKYLAGGGHLPL